ncbi:MAG: type III pantothenate kinase [Steroidobacteraceae bacterium]
MRTLLVDIGNSRVKWALLEDGRLGEQQAAAHAGWTPDDWRRALFARRGIDRVLAATVAGAGGADALRAAALLETGTEATFVTTTREAAGVCNGYQDAGLLGVDRWLAVIAAHRLVPGACCVVDVGTAATIDAVRADGQHLGGFIVPGPDLMMRSLWGGTSDLATRTAGSGARAAGLFADNTRDAIERGCRLAVAALIERCLDELARALPGPPVLLLTGGAAGHVSPYLREPGRLVPDLVLQGLSVVSAVPAV